MIMHRVFSLASKNVAPLSIHFASMILGPYASHSLDSRLTHRYYKKIKKAFRAWEPRSSRLSHLTSWAVGERKKKRKTKKSNLENSYIYIYRYIRSIIIRIRVILQKNWPILKNLDFNENNENLCLRRILFFDGKIFFARE